MRQQEGFSLVELMLVIMVLGIGLGLGVSSFVQVRATSEMAAAVNDLVASLHAARSEAVTRRSPVTICAASGDTDCDPAATFGTGWLIFPDANRNGLRDEGEPLLQAHGPLRAGLADRLQAIGRNGPVAYISFTPVGQLPPAGTPLAEGATQMQLCDFRGDMDTGAGVAAGRWIEVLPTGWPQVHRLREQVQGGPLGGC